MNTGRGLYAADAAGLIRKVSAQDSACIEAGTVAKVKLEVVSWLTPVFDAEERVRLKWEQEVEQGATVRDLFKQLTDSYPTLRGLVYDPGDGALTGLVSVIFNNRVLELAGGLDAAIQDGDSIVLLPAYAGGSRNATPAKEDERAVCAARPSVEQHGPYSNRSGEKAL